MIIQEAAEWLFLVDLKGAADTNVWAGEGEFSWDEFVDRLSTHDIRHKKNGPGFMPVLMKPESECQLIYPKNATSPPHNRGDVNIEAITALVIDIDAHGARDVAEQVFEGYEYLIYSTHNYNQNTPWKHRMVVRLQEPILVENWPLCFQALKSRINLDPSCCNPSRFYYYPSHSPDSEIPPEVDHKRGRAITLDQILGLAVDIDPVLKEKSKTVVKYRPTMRVRQSRSIAHFSGSTGSRFDSVADTVDMSWETMMERHKFAIETFKLGGSNHRLALSITAKEIAKMGPKVDLKSTLLFIFKVAHAEGDRPLETGNTMDELPGMIIDAMLKYAFEAYSHFANEHPDGLEPWIDGLVRWAFLSYETAQLPEAPAPSSDGGLSRVKPPPSAYEELKARHRGFLRDFIKSGDAGALFIEVLKYELRRPEPQYREIANALINYQYGYYTAVRELSSAEAWGTMKAEQSALSKLLSTKIDDLDERKQTYTRSSYLVEFMKRAPDQLTEPSTEPTL